MDSRLNLLLKLASVKVKPSVRTVDGKRVVVIGYVRKGRDRRIGVPQSGGRGSRVSSPSGGAKVAEIPDTRAGKGTPAGPKFGFLRPGNTPKPTKTVGKGTKDDPIITDSVDEAATALAAGKHVQLHQPDEVSTLLDRLAEIVEEAKSKGEKASLFDLCKISVPGTNLFCHEAIVEKRIEMPQLAGKPEPGSLADKLPKNQKGEVDLAGAFISHLQNNLGIEVEETTVDASHLRASQRQMRGEKVAGIYRALEAGTLPPGSVFVTEDNYLLDGHHRWAANVAIEIKQNKNIKMPVVKVHMSIIDALNEANDFTTKQGIPHAELSRNAVDELIVKLGLCLNC